MYDVLCNYVRCSYVRCNFFIHHSIYTVDKIHGKKSYVVAARPKVY
jgi:hypothetical protein